ncbi:uncharacterized protein P174DRAFT_159552 [Aspergillus novofumigatus IBT 16806]|uniref:Secreted protein n=1 Tax=Aspergillus novofumigatus (strain IBT 16806) TaxID=1392255 RepID=A0A2I1C7V6_ASPN1|nr:uncharacterized protein P174DRAFT_159552 [Aspergillus novofumigatus IBT 16806]PKX93713.1 hypothetical protein P174DRAFT_159552 [Aspergillus novofumigatus IBT 16806]
MYCILNCLLFQCSSGLEELLSLSRSCVCFSHSLYVQIWLCCPRHQALSLTPSFSLCNQPMHFRLGLAAEWPKSSGRISRWGLYVTDAVGTEHRCRVHLGPLFLPLLRQTRIRLCTMVAQSFAGDEYGGAGR